MPVGGKVSHCVPLVYGMGPDPLGDGSGPVLPLWLYEPVQLANGRLVLLMYIEETYREGRLSLHWYNRWMELNTGDYQLGSNDALLSLWDERLTGADQADEDWVRGQLLTGALLKYRAHRGVNKGPPPTAVDIDTLLKTSSKCVKIVKCGHKGYHVRLYPCDKVGRSDFKILNRLFPWTEAGDKQKTNLDLASLVYQSCKRGRVAVVAGLLARVTIGQVNAVVTGMLVAALGNHMWSKMSDLIDSDKTCCLTRKGYKNYFKGISVALRRTSRWADGTRLKVKDVSMGAYWELGIGRAANLSDPAVEVEKRCGAKLELTNPYNGQPLTPYLRIEIRKIVSQLMPKKDEWGTWSDFVQQRQAWAPSGSAGGAKAVVDGELIRVNKHGYFENLKPEIPLGWLGTTPQLSATFSQKLEAGKDRAIYGTGPPDQSIVTYVIKPLEKRMGRIPNFINGHEGLLEVADIAIKLGIVKDPSIECTMLDYADFNIQHTLENQEVLFAEVAAELAQFGNPDLDRAADWVREAQLNQRFFVPEDNRWYQVAQGMFSGVRSTDFMNTIMNLAYFNTMAGLLKAHTGLVPIGLFNVHKGDDVWISNGSRLWAAELYALMSKAGFVFQASKQMFDIGRGEFLRVLYTPDGAQGYAMRAVATLIIKPIQSVDQLVPMARASALTSQLHLLKRRGISEDACLIVWWAVVPHALRVPMPGHGGMGIPVGLAMKTFSRGGLDIGPPGTRGTGGTSTKPLPPMHIHAPGLSAQIGHYMSHDWVIYLSKRIQRDFDAKMVEDALHEANISDSLRPRDRDASMRLWERSFRRWRDEVREVVGGLEGARVDLTLNGQPTSSAMFAAGIIEMSLEEVKTTGNAPNRILPVLGSIQAGIAASPFRDLASAQRACKLSVIESARLCISMLASERRARDAMGALGYVRKVIGDEATTMALKGLGSVGISYEAYVHPVILSFVSDVATDLALLTAGGQRIENQYQWLEYADFWKLDLLLALNVKLDLEAWSYQ